MIRHLRKALALVAFAALSAGPFSTPVEAGSFLYFTPSGSTAGGQPVNAQALFTTEDGILTIVLTNLQANPTSVIQSISDLRFTLGSGNLDAATLSSSEGQEVTIANDGSFTLGDTVDTGWDATLGGTTGYLNVLGTAIGPAHTLIGGPGGGGTYSNAGGSIAGNGPHNPFLNQSATFTIVGEGITADSIITSAIFSFGTEPGTEVTGIVPEPSSVVLLGTAGIALLGLARLRRRSR